LGTPSHLLCTSGTYRWVKDVPVPAWHLSGELKPGNCLDTLLLLNGSSLEIEPPAQFVKVMETCMSGSGITPPWQKLMPKDSHHAFMRGIITQAEESLSSLDREYLEGPWMTGEAVLASLRPAHVDREIWKRLLADRVGNWRVVQTFQPNMLGQCKPVSYNRFGTRTGRLTSGAGPGILTLKRDYRNMLRSRHREDGVIAYLDFCNLEARILLYESGGRCDDPDLYSYINREVFDGAMQREDIKGAVISELYGQSKWALGKRLGLTGKHLNHFIERVRMYFNTQKLLSRVKSQFVDEGYITNRYGRRVEIDEPLDRIFINSYTQSTGVDVTMLGFHQVIEATRRHRIDPIFLLHDAMLLDCHKDDLHHLRKINTVRIKGYVQSFPLSLELLGCTLPTQEVHS
jgi:hypothetical protein